MLTIGDSAGRPVHYWLTTGTSVTAAGDTLQWELRQTYDAITLQPYAIVRTAVPIWGPGMTKSEQRRFTIVGKVDVDVEGKTVNAWKVEEHRESDAQLLATWYLLDKAPYMVDGELPLPDRSVQRMTEVAVPIPEARN